LAIMIAAQSTGVPADLLVAICSHETHLENVVVPHDGGRNDLSVGICQIKPSTAAGEGYKGVAHGKLRKSKRWPWAKESDGDDVGLMVPEVNALYAAMYLKRQLKRYDDNWCRAAAAYNAGSYRPSAVVPGMPKNKK